MTMPTARRRVPYPMAVAVAAGRAGTAGIVSPR